MWMAGAVQLQDAVAVVFLHQVRVGLTVRLPAWLQESDGSTGVLEEPLSGF